jgi:hypothetical protein
MRNKVWNPPVSILLGAIVWAAAAGGQATAQAVHGVPIGGGANSPPVRGEPIVPAQPPQAAPTGDSAKASPPPMETKPAANSETKQKPAEEYADLGFEVLGSYEFEVSDKPVVTRAAGPDAEDKKIPDKVRTFDQKKVQIKGFMVPLEMAGDKATEFLLLKDPQMCCYGIVPRLNEWVTVKTVGKGVPVVMDQAVSIQGTLHVGVIRDSSGYISGVYKMDGEKIAGN